MIHFITFQYIFGMDEAVFQITSPDVL